MKYQFKRENVKSLRDIAYESIKEAILSSDLQPGEKLTESDLSEQLGISRGPIREAFRQLERDGLVHSQPYKGTVVAEFSMEETDQVYIPIRQQIERYACCQAMELFGEEDYTFLESCITEMECSFTEARRALNGDLPIGTIPILPRLANRTADGASLPNTKR